MQKILLAIIMFAVSLTAYADEPDTPALPEKGGDVKIFAQYPPLAPGQTTYVVQENEATGLTIDTLNIPDGVTVKLAPNVSAIDWTVKTIRFGRNATIDLAASTPAPDKAADGAPPPGQPDYCKIGVRGNNGHPGAPGVDAHTLTLRSIERVILRGSLWIRTDGGNGGAGGNGAQGQQGGGPRKRFAFPCDAARGADGGAGGAGGVGGNTSAITLSFRRGAPDINSGGMAACGQSTRPSGASGDTGAISISGGVGCGGAGGAGGPGGLGGDVSAPNGNPGPNGAAGSNGTILPVRIIENE